MLSNFIFILVISIDKRSHHIRKYCHDLWDLWDSIHYKCFREMLSHQHTLLQHDFTQPPSNKKATKQNLSLAFSENLQISRQIITGEPKILSYFFLTCCDSEPNIVEEFHSKSLSFKYHKFVELKKSNISRRWHRVSWRRAPGSKLQKTLNPAPPLLLDRCFRLSWWSWSWLLLWSWSSWCSWWCF